MRALLAGIGLMAGMPGAASAAVGDVDRSFGNQGSVILRYSDTTQDHASGVIAQSTGRIVVVGTSNAGTAAQRRDLGFRRLMLVRLRANGALDRDFSRSGRRLVSLRGASAVIAVDAVKDLRSDGFYVLALIRRDTDLPESQCRKRALFDCYDNRRSIGVFRFRADGSADPRFSGDGVFTFAAGRERRGGEGGQDIDVPMREPISLAVTRAGRVYVADRSTTTPSTRIVRLTADGSGADRSWGTNGRVAASILADSLIVDHSGRPVLSGSWDGALAVVRVTASGQRDTSWGGTGRVVHTFTAGDPAGDFSRANDIVQLGPGAYVTGGTIRTDLAERFHLATRLRIGDGALDRAFNTNGFNIADFRPLAPGGDAEAIGRRVVLGFGGRVVVGGSVTLEAFRPIQQGVSRYQWALSVFTGDGAIVRRLATDISASADETLTGLAVERDGDVVAVGNVDLDFQECCARPRIAVVRYKAR